MDKGVPSVTEWHASDVLISFSKAGMKNGVINPKTVCMMWTLTKPEFLLEAYADDYEAEHVDEQMNNSGMEPHAGDQTPSLAAMDNLRHIESPCLH